MDLRVWGKEGIWEGESLYETSVASVAVYLKTDV